MNVQIMSVAVHYSDGEIEIFERVVADNLAEATTAVRNYLAVTDPDKLERMVDCRCGNDCAVR